MRDKLIELIKEARDIGDRHCKEMGSCAKCHELGYDIGKCGEIIIADHLISHGVTFADVPETNVGKWIPISERLPEPRRSIEMYFPSKEMVCLGFFEKVGPLDIWCVYTPNNANVCQIKPTHWRYRTIVPASPEPPKEFE